MVHLPHWPDLRLRTKGLLVVAVPAAATVVLALTVYILGNRTAFEEQWVRQSLRVSETIQRQRACEAELGSVVSAYFITSDPVFAKQTRDAVAAFEATRQKLSDLTGDRPRQGQRLLKIAALQRPRVERVFGDMARVAAGALSLEELRSAICVFLGVVCGIVISLLFACGITKRIAGLQKNVDKLRSGGVLDPLGRGGDEIGALGEGIARTAEILRRRTTALENALHGIAEVDMSGRCLSYNKAYAELAGLPDRCVAVNMGDSVHPDDRPKVERAIGAMLNSGRAEVEARMVHRDGRKVHVTMTLLPVSDCLEAGYYVFLYDSTLRRETEAALIMAKDAAVASNLARTQFLAKISHDIRTPLNAILGAADLLSLTTLNRDQSEYVDMFQRNCRRLVRLINDFLDFSRIEAGAVEVQKAPCHIRTTVDEAAATFRESASRKGVELDFEIGSGIPEWAIVDSARVQQVLDNLISNAVKFTAAGKVEIQVQKTSMPYGDAIRFAVRDTGPGIEQVDAARIFAAFTQLPDRDSSERGSGLGLTICRELVELMGGEIGVSSVRGYGSTFHFTLPLQTVTEAGVVPAAPPSNVCSGWCLEDPARILAAEDTADNRLLLEHYLRGEPVEITFAFNGEEAFEVSQRREFDLILMDIDMPGIDGYEATRLIRSWQAENGRVPTPIVALSAHAMKEAVRASLQAGCVAHVAKPVDRAVLLKTIRRFALSKSVRAQCPSGVCVVADGVAALVPVYLASKPRQIDEARAALARHDLDAVRRFGHNLKGTGAGYGFPRIQEIGTAIEKAAQINDEESLRKQLEALYRFVTEDRVESSVVVK